MQVPEILEAQTLGQEIKKLAFAAIGGAAILALLGFTWGGWMLGKTAKTLAATQSASAVVAALAPICVDKFQSATAASDNLAELKKVSSWQQGSFVEKGGWATLPGNKAPDTAVARACAEMLSKLK